jgi:hypothetical protein
MGWSGSTQYRILTAELATANGHVFERRVLPIIRLIWHDAIIPPSLRWLDQAGIDIMVWSDRQPFPLVVQCKGFEVLEEEVGPSQIHKCLASITSFKERGLKADTYLLVHNRTNKNPELRKSVGDALNDLVASGQVRRAQLWGHRELLDEAHEAVFTSINDAITRKQATAEQDYGEQLACERIEQVPFRLSNLTIDANHLLKVTDPIFAHKDPAEEILKGKGSNILVVIGEAGYGKTTASLRTVSISNQQVIYVPASSIPTEVNSTSLLLKHCIKIGNLLDDTPPFNSELFDRIGASVIHYLFKKKTTPIVLIIDGLDESVYFSRRGGLQSVFNQVRELEVPVVFTARTEFWSQRLIDFTSMFGTARESHERHHRKVRLIELLPWENDDIALLVRRYRDAISDELSRERLQELVTLVERDEYEELYGDIPRRPLFLGFILETVAERGIQRTGRAKLYYDWMRMKIMRDITRPMRWGNMGRDRIISDTESSDSTLRLSLAAMMQAAHKMTQRVEGSLELLPNCVIDDVISSDERLKNITEPTSLFLNSLLVPIQTDPEFPLRIRFGHRAYQEFFLSLYMKHHRSDFDGVNIPGGVAHLLADLDAEGID